METGMRVLVLLNDYSRYSLVPPEKVFDCSLLRFDKNKSYKRKSENDDFKRKFLNEFGNSTTRKIVL